MRKFLVSLLAFSLLVATPNIAFGAPKSKALKVTKAFQNLLSTSDDGLSALESEYESQIDILDAALAAATATANLQLQTDLAAASSLYTPQINSSNKKVEDAKKIIDEANKLAEEADMLNAQVLDYTDELLELEDSLKKLTKASESLINFGELTIGKWNQLIERISILPTNLQSALKKSNDYKSARKVMNQVSSMLLSKEKLDKQINKINRPSQIYAIAITYAALEVGTSQLTSFNKSVKNLNKIIPIFVCQKDLTTLSASKTGKCDKGFLKISTL